MIATCASCIYALSDQEAKKHNVTAEQYLCHGLPPTAQLVPVQGPGGGQWVGMAVRPPVKADDMACNLYQAKIELRPVSN